MKWTDENARKCFYDWTESIIDPEAEGDFLRFNVHLSPNGELCADIAQHLDKAYVALFIAYGAAFGVFDAYEGRGHFAFSAMLSEDVEAYLYEIALPWQPTK